MNIVDINAKNIKNSISTQPGQKVDKNVSSTKKSTEELLGNILITDFSQIEEDFMIIYNQITKQKFNNTIIINNRAETHKKTNGKPAAIRKKILFGKNKIWIREMLIYEMFYELSHEIGHALRPHLEFNSIAAEEIKAVLFQYIFSHFANQGNFSWIEDFNRFEKRRINQINQVDPDTYAIYHQFASRIAFKCNYDFDVGSASI